MTTGRGARAALWLLAGVVLAFIYVPPVVVTVNSFNADKTFAWPPTGGPPVVVRRRRVARSARSPGMSVRAGLGATAIAVVLGTLLALALTRYRFGRQAISLLVILPIALPGIVTGIALQSVISRSSPRSSGSRRDCSRSSSGTRPSASWSSSTMSARLRRDGWVTGAGLRRPRVPGRGRPPAGDLFPAARSAPVAGALLASAVLRRDRRHHLHGRSRHADAAHLDLQQPLPAEPGPVVNVVAVVLPVASILPVWVAQRVGGSAAVDSRP